MNHLVSVQRSIRRCVAACLYFALTMLITGCVTMDEAPLIERRIDAGAPGEVPIYRASRVGTFWYFGIPIPIVIPGYICAATSTGDFECK